MNGLIIYKYIVPEYDNKDYELRRSNEVADWIKSGHFLRKLFRYGYAEYYSSNLSTQPSQFILCVVLWLLSPGQAVLKDQYGRCERITFGTLCLKAYREFFDLLSYPLVLFNINKRLNHIEKQISDKQIKNLRLNDPPAYLRTDLVPGLQCGGSVGHIAGVLNNLDQFCGSPCFITTDKIPTVRDDLVINIIEPENKFWGFQELPELYFNEKCFVRSCRILDNQPLAFIYQRYALYNYTGVQLSTRYSVPFVLEYNGSAVWIAKNWGQSLKYERLGERIELYNLRMADLVVVVSKPLLHDLVSLGIDQDKILVNPNGVEPQRYSPDVSGEPVIEKYALQGKKVIGFIGTFGKWHGAERLVDAIAHLINKHPEYKNEIRVLLVGDGDMAALVREKISTNSLEEICILTGLVPQAEGPGYLAACDVLVSPHVPNPDGSPFFGSPTKLFEYMAMGKGIVASKLDQIADILSHNETAWLVKPGDEESLMLGIKTLLDDPGLSDRLGRAAREEAVKQYTWKHHTGRIIEKLKERCQQ